MNFARFHPAVRRIYRELNLFMVSQMLPLDEKHVPEEPGGSLFRFLRERLHRLVSCFSSIGTTIDIILMDLVGRGYEPRTLKSAPS